MVLTGCGPPAARPEDEDAEERTEDGEDAEEREDAEEDETMGSALSSTATEEKADALVLPQVTLPDVKPLLIQVSQKPVVGVA